MHVSEGERATEAGLQRARWLASRRQFVAQGRLRLGPESTLTHTLTFPSRQPGCHAPLWPSWNSPLSFQRTPDLFRIHVGGQ
jgi:hypothetical protein